MIQLKEGFTVYQRPGQGEKVVNLTQLARESNYRVGNIAEYLGVSTRQLQRDFEEGIGVTPKYWLREQRIEDVYELINQGIRPQEVARKTGFKKYENFVNEVMSFYGVKPNELVEKD